MLRESEAFSGFAVDNIEKAKEFYGEVLGLIVDSANDMGLLTLKLSSGKDIIIYEKPDFKPASYTILNFPVSDIDTAVDGLTTKGVVFEKYEGFTQDEKGIARGAEGGPDIAWFKDPAGNILSVLQA